MLNKDHLTKLLSRKTLNSLGRCPEVPYNQFLPSVTFNLVGLFSRGAYRPLGYCSAGHLIS